MSSKARRAPHDTDTIANQVFVGLPWTIKARWEKVIDSLKSRSPLSFVIVGRNDKQDAEDLLAIIKGRIDASSYAIFDATGGNANVSLEYGYAEAVDLPRVLYVSTHRNAAKAAKDSPIISDLAGKRRNHYKQESGLKTLLLEFTKSHAFTLRFERFVAQATRGKKVGSKNRFKALALKIIHQLDGQKSVRHADIVHQLQGDVAKYSADEIKVMIRKLHEAEIVRSQQGRHARINIA